MKIYLNSTLLKEHNYDNDRKYKLTRKKNRKNVKPLSITKMYILCKVKKKIIISHYKFVVSNTKY